MHHFLYAANSLIRTAHLDKAKSSAINEALEMIAKASVLYDFLQIYSSSALVRQEFQVLFCFSIVQMLISIDDNFENTYLFCICRNV